MVVTVTMVLVAGCTDDGVTSPTLPPPEAVTTTTGRVREDDGVLRIAILLPHSGAGATIGQPLIDAVVAAGNAINLAGGVLGRRIQVIPGFDEGDDPTTAKDAIATLIEQDVDAVVGPASSTIALATLDDLLGAGIVTCSPTATALALDDFPDRKLFVRTAPSDSLQAKAIALLAERTGARVAAVVYLDDAYGRPFEQATVDALRASGLTVEDRIGFESDEDSLVDEAAAVNSLDAGVIVVLADAEQGTRLLTALADTPVTRPSAAAPAIIVNDAMRRPLSAGPIAELPAEMRERIIGVSPAASTGAPNEPPGPFATNAADCVNLIALAAAQAGSDDPAAIAEQIPAVSAVGFTCETFAACIGRVEDGGNIDYDGPSGSVQIGANGDPAHYLFDRWTFDEQGVDVDQGIGPLAVP